MNVETDSTLAGLAARVEQVEARLTALEAADQGASPEPPSAGAAAGDGGLDPERFWALHGLQQRLGEPGGVLFTGSVLAPTGNHYVWQQAGLTDDLLDDAWPDVADALGALGHPTRLGLLQAVLNGWNSTAELAQVDEVGTTGQLHHHLRPLLAAGWLHSPRRGRYEIPAARVVPLLAIVEAVRR